MVRRPGRLFAAVARTAKEVPRTGWRFVRHLNRLLALAFLRPVRTVSLGAAFPIPLREPILRPGFRTPLPSAGRAQATERTERRLGIAIRPARKERDFRPLALRPGGEVLGLDGAERVFRAKHKSVNQNEVPCGVPRLGARREKSATCRPD